MREIKFRVWHKQEQKMYDVVSLCCSGSDDHGDVEVRDGMYIGREFMARNVELMQYTGLKDHADKEIYEGDIVGSDEPGRCVVVFVHGAFRPQLIPSSLPYPVPEGPHYDGHWDDLAVIGNIYEHPELLED